MTANSTLMAARNPLARCQFCSCCSMRRSRSARRPPFPSPIKPFIWVFRTLRSLITCASNSFIIRIPPELQYSHQCSVISAYGSHSDHRSLTTIHWQVDKHRRRELRIIGRRRAVVNPDEKTITCCFARKRHGLLRSPHHQVGILSGNEGEITSPYLEPASNRRRRPGIDGHCRAVYGGHTQANQIA